ncbi:hypothetical protein D3C76_1109960 [compost metagenome]
MIKTNILPYGVMFSYGKWRVFSIDTGKVIERGSYKYRVFATMHRDFLNSNG